MPPRSTQFRFLTQTKNRQLQLAEFQQSKTIMVPTFVTFTPFFWQKIKNKITKKGQEIHESSQKTQKQETDWLRSDWESRGDGAEQLLENEDWWLRHHQAHQQRHQRSHRRLQKPRQPFLQARQLWIRCFFPRMDRFLRCHVCPLSLSLSLSHSPYFSLFVIPRSLISCTDFSL